MTSAASARRTQCEECAGPLPLMARADARYCGATCRKRASRARLAAEQERVAGEQASRIPAELTSRPRWVRYSSRKVPLRTDGRFASVQDPSSWSDFQAAGGAQAIVDRLPATSMERGGGGSGLRLWFRGAVPHGRRVRRGEVAVEVYSDRRYIIVGDRVSGTPLELAELPDAAGLVASL